MAGNKKGGRRSSKAASANTNVDSASIKSQMKDAGYVKKNFNLEDDSFMSNFQKSMALNAPGLDPTVPNALFGTNLAPNPNLAAENAPQEQFQGFPALFSGIADAVGGFANSPIGNIVGMATNPAAFFGGQALKNIYGAYNDEDDDTGIMSALGKAFQQSTPFGEISTAIGNPFSGAPNAGELNTTTEVDDRFGGNLALGNLANQEVDDRFGGNLALGNLSNQDLSNQTPGFFDNVKTDYNNTKDFFGNLFSGLDIQPNDLEAERMGNRGPGDGPRIPLPGDFDYVTPLPDPRYGTGGPGISPPPIGFGSTSPEPSLGDRYARLYGAENYDRVYNMNQGGRVGYNDGGIAALLNLSGNVGRSGGENYDSFEANPSISMNDLELYANLTGDKDEQLLNEIGAAYELANGLSLNVGMNPNQPQEFSEPEDTIFARLTKSFNQGGLTAPLSGPMPNGIGGLFKPIS